MGTESEALGSSSVTAPRAGAPQLASCAAGRQRAVDEPGGGCGGGGMAAAAAAAAVAAAGGCGVFNEAWWECDSDERREELSERSGSRSCNSSGSPQQLRTWRGAEARGERRRGEGWA